MFRHDIVTGVKFQQFLTPQDSLQTGILLTVNNKCFTMSKSLCQYIIYLMYRLRREKLQFTLGWCTE